MSGRGRWRWLVLGVLGWTAGCGGGSPEKKGEPTGPPQVKVEAPKGTEPVEKPPTPVPAASPFRASVLLEPPDGELRPPDKTFAGKNAAQLFQAIAGTKDKPGLWDQVSFVDSSGKMVRHTALIKTDLGDMRLRLLHEHAPNHVRSFVALARAGYYDGLPIHRSIRTTEPKDKAFLYLEAGCPKGTGEVGYGSIGYWLKPEISKDLKHEEGSVGAWHAGEIESAACRFYVTLGPTPALDGSYSIFGKMTEGLDVARKINALPVRKDDLQDRPVDPVILRQVAIETKLE